MTTIQEKMAQDPIDVSGYVSILKETEKVCLFRFPHGTRKIKADKGYYCIFNAEKERVEIYSYQQSKTIEP